jgi:serine protease Do
MKLHRSFLAAALFVSSSLLGSPGESAFASAERRSLVVQAVELNRPAVVNLTCERVTRAALPDDAVAPSQRSNGMGTGIIVDPRGYIVTNQHVVDDTTSIKVRLSDGSSFTARVIARDRDTDLALIKIESMKPLPVVKIGTSSDLMVGEDVIAVGNAFGYEHTVTKGVVSALNRDVSLNKEMSYKSLIQTDASINPGNSGGPLLNIDGDLVGVNVAIRAGAQGIGFAIPVDHMIAVVTDMLANTRRGDIAPGLVCRNAIDLSKGPLCPVRYLRVDKVEPGTPAAKAGVKPGDVLLRAGDIPQASTLDLERALIDAKPGDELRLLVRRDGKEEALKLTLASRDTGSIADLVWHQLGLRLAGTNSEVVTRTHPSLRGGMLVTAVAGDSLAAKAGIQVGDILVGLHQWETLSMDNLAFVLRHTELATFQPLKFYILRAGTLHKGTLE